ncbi:hypothetical protein [Pedobacter suwonensis]|nr:hypothetical protein [Pedobacter suwonensis]
MKLFFIAVFTACTLACMNASAQNTEKLTNAKIIAMVKGGLPKAAIVKSIENKQSGFDTSTAALIALKKQGVPDDVITAMVSKGSETASAPTTASALPKSQIAKPATVKMPFPPFKAIPSANAKDCRLREVKTKDGGKETIALAPTKLGDFAIGRDRGKLTLVYNTNSILSMIVQQDTKNLATLHIDSAQFLFDENTVLTIKTTGSYGSLPNRNLELKPQLENINLMIVLEPGSKEEHIFTTGKLKLFQVFAEKNGKYGDKLNEKQQAKFTQAFNCIPE